MITLYGVTEDGTSVPVQVTDDGKLIVHKDESFQPGDDIEVGNISAAGSITTAGDAGIGTGAPQARLHVSNSEGGAEGRILLDADVTSGYDTRIDATDTGLEFTAGSNSRGFVFNTGSTPTPKVTIEPGGSITAADGKIELLTSGGAHFTNHIRIDEDGDFIVHPNIELLADGRIIAADGKAGFTADGEVYFTSRGIRYKLEVAGGLCNAIEYTPEMQLRERAEDKRKPRPTDSVPED